MSPIYIIHCLDCGAITEEFFPTTDVTKWRCGALVKYKTRGGRSSTTTCRSDKKEKLPTSASFRLHNEKCGGFTKTSSKTPSAG